MARCTTYINGHFFEYECEGGTSGIEPDYKGIQYKVITDLATEPVTVDFLKQHIRVDFDTDDNLLESYLKEARQDLEQYSQLSFGAKTMKLLALKLPANYHLMYGPVDEITDPVDKYTLFGDIVTDANGSNIEITYTTAWPAGLPEPIKIAICRRAAGLYINRENMLTQLSGQSLIDQSEKALDRYRNQFVI